MVDHIMHACPRSPVILNSLHKIWKWSLFPLTNWSFTYEGILHFFYRHFNLLFILQVLSLIVITHAIHTQEISARPIPLGFPNTGLEWKEKRTHHFHPWHVQQPVQFNFLHRTGEVSSCFHLLSKTCREQKRMVVDCSHIWMAIWRADKLTKGCGLHNRGTLTMFVLHRIWVTFSGMSLLDMKTCTTILPVQSTKW
jgi:hypothetical protein